MTSRVQRIINSAGRAFMDGDYQSGSVLEFVQELERLAVLLDDLGIDPDLDYSTLDRALIRAQLAGCRVAGVRAG